MKKILIFVSSVDGKITKWGNPDVRIWSSKDDQAQFDEIWESTRVILMGRKSYDAYPVSPRKNHVFIILTRHPEDYSDINVPGKLEFTDKAPLDIVERFLKDGEEKMLVLGGPNIATLFLKENLIDEIWLTIEPRIFGTGGNFVIDERLDIDLTLLSIKKVNEKGTLLTRYKVTAVNPVPSAKSPYLNRS